MNTEQESEVEESEEVDFDSLANEFFEPTPDQEASPAQAEEAQAKPVPDQADSQEEAEKPKEVLSPLLAEKARQERELRAKLEETKGSIEQQVRAAREQLVAELKTNPQKFISDYGIDNVGDLAAHFYAAELGDDAPPELKSLLGKSELEQYKASVEVRFAEMELQRDRAAIQARNQATIDQYNGFLSAVPEESLPYLAAEASHDQQAALAAMAEVADHLYQQNGSYPSAVEVAKLIEEQISSTAARYEAVKSKRTNVEKPKTDSVKTKQTQTLSTEFLGNSAPGESLSEDELFADALKYLDEHMPSR